MEEKIIFDRVIQRVLSVSDEEFADLSVSRLALFFNMERSKLSRQFKRQLNITLESFLFREKMSRAAFLLMANRNITVKEVAEKLGFCACDYFIKKFKGYYGTRPGSYKEIKNHKKASLKTTH
ncbi:MAG: helix-turn-helix transcriptional regulator [Candidatus Aminicenantes bacterium]|jgi:AraC-like DNA-binding protein